VLRPFTDMDRAPFAELNAHPVVVEVPGALPFVGLVGLHRVPPALPASLAYGFGEAGLVEIVAFTTTRNSRSQAVMDRIGMVRDPHADFDHPGLPEGNPLRRRVLYRADAAHGRATVAS
jgi:hypothetical protein